MAVRHVVCPVAELRPGDRRIVEVAGRSIGVFNIRGQYFALRNVCPHQQAPLCMGQVTGTTLPSAVGEYRYGREGEIIRCPWHGWEFDITNGRSIFNPHRVRVKTYPVEVEAEKGEGCTDGCTADEGEDPSVETYPVRVERNLVVLYV